VNERGVHMENPCARFKPLKDQSAKARKKPPTYTPDELDRLFAICNEGKKPSSPPWSTAAATSAAPPRCSA